MATKGFYGRNRGKVHRLSRDCEKTANFTVTVPAYSRVRGFYLAERNGFAVTGGVRVGSTAAGTQFLVAGAVAASSNNYHPAVAVPQLSAVPQTLYVEAVTAWNGAKVDLRVDYEVVDYV